MSDEKQPELPFKMERFYHRDDYKDGSLTITFENAGHLCDAWNFAEKHGKGVDFERAIMRLVRIALGSAIPRPTSTWPDGQTFEAQPGRDTELHIYPDSFNEPSFCWNQKDGLVGGLIWHHRSGGWPLYERMSGWGEWSIHT